MSQWGALPLPSSLLDELIHRARSEAPQECCGLISLGDEGYRLRSAGNAAEDPLHSFTIDPKEQLTLLGEIEDTGEQLVGIYHSHPHSGPEPSERDREIAHLWPDIVWVIIGLRPFPSFFAGHP